jgi:DNA-binding Lrp family transcriptional regulator
MDSLDIRLYRAMFPGSMFTIAGIDPRLTIQELSKGASASRVTVRTRLSRWRDGGFWKNVVAYPNPDALGTSFQMGAVMLEPGRHRVRAESALVDMLEPAFLFQADDLYNPVYLKQPDGIAEGRQQRFLEVDGCHVTCPPVDLPFPPSTQPLGLRDWEIIRSLRRAREPNWPTVAEEVGVTVRGLQRRVARLIEGKALFFFPEVDFRCLPGSTAWVGILFAEGVDTARLQAEVVQRYPDLFRVEPVFPFELMLPSSGRPPIGGRFPFFVPVPSASSGDRLRRDFQTIPGVVDVVVGFPTQNISVPRAFDIPIEAAIKRLKGVD